MRLSTFGVFVLCVSMFGAALSRKPQSSHANNNNQEVSNQANNQNGGNGGDLSHNKQNGDNKQSDNNQQNAAGNPLAALGNLGNFGNLAGLFDNKQSGDMVNNLLNGALNALGGGNKQSGGNGMFGNKKQHGNNNQNDNDNQSDAKKQTEKEEQNGGDDQQSTTGSLLDCLRKVFDFKELITKLGMAVFTQQDMPSVIKSWLASKRESVLNIIREHLNKLFHTEWSGKLHDLPQVLTQAVAHRFLRNLNVTCAEAHLKHHFDIIRSMRAECGDNNNTVRYYELWPRVFYDLVVDLYPDNENRWTELSDRVDQHVEKLLNNDLFPEELRGIVKEALKEGLFRPDQCVDKEKVAKHAHDQIDKLLEHLFNRNKQHREHGHHLVDFVRFVQEKFQHLKELADKHFSN